MAMLVFDLSHLAYCSLFSAKSDIKDIGWAYLKHMIYSRIFSLCKKFDPEQVVIAVDSKENWRKKVYPEYKAHRKEKRDAQDDIDWNAFYNTIKEFVSEIKEHFPFYVLEIKYLEADDIVGILAKDYQNIKKIIVTADGDFLQLLKYKNIEIFDPIRFKYLTVDDPVKFLKVKCLMGDAGDNIKPIKPRIGEVTATKLVESPDKLKEILEDKTPSYTKPDGTVVTLGEEYKENYKNNIILIDLTKTPDVFSKELKKQFDEYNLPTGKTIFQYFSKNKYREFLRKMEEIEVVITKIINFEKENKKNKEAFGDLF
jgi:5'-3' exonuclease